MKETIFKRSFICLICLFFVTFLCAQSDTLDVDVTDENSWGEIILGSIGFIIYIGLFLAVIGHMVYILVNGKRYKLLFSIEEMKAKRIEVGKKELMTEEEEEKALELLDEAFKCWTVVEETEDDELRTPTKMKQIKQSVQYLDEAIALQPTEESILTRLNQLTGVINQAEERSFDGSKKLITLGIIVAILMYWMMGLEMTISTLFATGIYFLASRTPQFLIDKKAKRKAGNIHNGIFAGVFAMIAGAQTIRTVTKWSDGTKTVDDDNSQTWMALILGFMIIVAMAMMMWVWALLNYLRNYVFYF